MDKLTVKELKEKCKLKKLKGYSGLKKYELIKLLKKKNMKGGGDITIIYEKIGTTDKVPIKINNENLTLENLKNKLGYPSHLILTLKTLDGFYKILTNNNIILLKENDIILGNPTFETVPVLNKKYSWLEKNHVENNKKLLLDAQKMLEKNNSNN